MCIATIPVNNIEVESTTETTIAETASTTSSTITTTEIETSSEIVTKFTCPSGWALFDRTTYSWCMSFCGFVDPNDYNYVYADAINCCQSKNAKSIVTGFQTAEELQAMVKMILDASADNEYNAYFVGAEKAAKCSTETCSPEDMFEWTDGYTSGSDGFIWDETPNVDYSVYAELYMYDEALRPYEESASGDGAICGMLAEEVDE